MKKIFITIIAILLPLLTSATDINGINFDLDSSTKTATVVQGSYSGYIYIYSYVTYEGVTYTVTSIGENAFRNSDITDVWIPNTVTSIGKCSFGACSSLNYITIPGSVTEIGPAAFYGCSALKNVILPSGLKQIDENLFWGCTSLTSVTIPAGVTKIAEEAFRECLVLPSINIPSSVIEIGDRAFEDCTSLKSIFSEIQTPFAIPDNVFNGIPSDATLTVLKGTKTAYQNTAGWSVISDGTTEIQTKRTIHVATAGTLPQLISAEEKYYIEELTLTGELNGTDFKLIREMAGVIAIECDDSGSGDDLLHRWAEYNPTQGLLTSLNLADSRIVSGGAVYDYEGGGKSPDYYYTVSDAISPYLFSRTNIESIILPNSITSIGTCVFYNCSSLTSVTIPNSVISIDGAAFGGSSLTSIQVESGNNKYDSRNNCNAIIEKSTNTLIVGFKNTIIPNSVTSIGNNAFRNCSGLTSVTIPNSVTSIGEGAFFGCSGLTSVTIPNSVTSIGSEAFSGTPWFNKQPNGLLYVGKIAYKYIGDMPENTSIVIENGTVGIADNAFRGCSGLTSVTIPNSVTSIGDYAFNNNGLISVSIGNSVTTIGEYAFSGCRSLTSVTIPNSVISIRDWAFYYCSGLTSVTIPNSVTSIGEGAFFGCSGLTSVEIPNSVILFGDKAFKLCTSLTSVTIPNSVTTIGEHAFSGCRSLTSVTIPNSVISIRDWAFSYCSGLTSVTIPNSVTSIGMYAFQYCSGLTAIKVESGNQTYDSRDNCNAIIEKSTNTLIAGCKNTIIPNNVTSIGNYAFSGCSGLTSVTIPNSVTSIGSDAFSWCSGLTSVTIPNSVKSIGSDAFFSCSGLTTIYSLNNTPSTCEQYYSDYYTQFNSVDKTKCVVWVPKGCVNAYKEAGGWKDLQNIRELALGDVNIDFEVNQADLDATVDFIMDKDPEGFYESLADLNGDDKVDAADVVKLVTILNIQEGLNMDW